MAESPEPTYGTTRSGRPITEALIEEWVAEAETGYDLAQLQVVNPVGRPRMGSAPAKTFPVRLDPSLRSALDQRAAAEDRPAAEVVRDALRQYLAAS